MTIIYWLYCEIRDKNKQLQQKCKKQKEVIDKAIEYIEDNSDDMYTYISQAITQILKGSDKE